MFRIVKKLYQINIITPKGFILLIGSIIREGINLMAILRFSSMLYPKRIAIKENKETTTYAELFKDSKRLALLLKNKYNLDNQSRVALLCRNHLVVIQTLFALSRLGVNVYLLNIEMSSTQLKKIITDKNFDLIVYDSEKEEDIKKVDFQKCILSYHEIFPSIYGLLKNQEEVDTKLRKYKSGNIVVLTGGTTGEFKTASRKPSITNFTNPFFALLTDIHIDRYRSVYIATPIYHGYGLASLIVSAILGIELSLLNKYKTEDACKLIRENKIEAVILVPLMLQRMLKHDRSTFYTVKCILSGGAPLDANLTCYTLQELGDVLYNLYGTSEAGFSVLAKPHDLRKYPTTIGKPIRGVSIKIVDNNQRKSKIGTVGMVCIKNQWVMDNKSNQWVSTGDLGYIDKDGYVFLRGRSDNMIVSGGENVYPEELEKVLMQNELIECASVIGIPDVEFGQRLKAFVVLKEKSKLTEDMLLKWLIAKVARYQMPAHLRIIDSLPMSSTGKVDKKKLSFLK